MSRMMVVAGVVVILSAVALVLVGVVEMVRGLAS